jgi:hypothetical protein
VIERGKLPIDDGRLCYRLKTRWCDGTTHIALEPPDLLERLAALERTS